MKIHITENDSHAQIVKGDEVIYEENLNKYRSEENKFEPDNEQVISKIFPCHMEDLPDGFSIDSFYRSDLFPNASWLVIDKDNGKGILKVIYEFPLLEWSQPFVINDFLNELERHSSPLLEVDTHMLDMQPMVYAKKHLNSSQNIEEQCFTLMTEFDSLCEEVTRNLSKPIFEQHILKVFEFPNDYKTICSQYLMWFGEFLEQFGINALISVNNDGNETQVIVSSKHTEEMFSKIEALFSQYVALPYAEYLPASHNVSPEQQFMIIQLKSQVDSFKSQLEMKSAALDLKIAENKILQHKVDEREDKLCLLESMKGEDVIELFDGVLKIGVLEWGPIKISPRKLLNKTII